MNSIPAKEIKRRGISAVDKLLKKGPVHVIKNNRPAYVITRAPEHGRAASEPRPGSVWEFLSARPWRGQRSRKDIDAQVAAERASWGDE